MRTTLHFAHIRSFIRGTAFPQPQHSARWLVRLSRRSWREGRFSSYPARILGSETVTIVGIWMVGFAALGLGIDMYVQLRLCYAVKYWFSEIMVMGRGERDPGPRVSLEDSLRDLGPWALSAAEFTFRKRIRKKGVRWSLVVVKWRRRPLHVGRRKKHSFELRYISFSTRLDNSLGLPRCSCL